MELIKAVVCIIMWGYLELSVYLKLLHHAISPTGTKGTSNTSKVFMELLEDKPVQKALQTEQTDPQEELSVVEEGIAVYVESALDEAGEALLAELFAQTELITETGEQPLQQPEEIIELGKAGSQEGTKAQNTASAVWQVEVIGTEAGYIHVLHEGSRKWLFVGEQHHFPIYSILKVYIDFSCGVEDVLDIEVLYDPVEDEYKTCFDDKYTMVL